MIERLSEAMSIKIKNASPERTNSVAVLSYALSILLNFFFICFFLLLIGILTDSLQDSFIALMSFVALRFFSGGYHLKSLDQCVIVTTAIIAVVPHIPVNYIVVYLLTAISVILVFCLAPNSTYENLTVPRKVLILKLSSVLIVSTNFVFGSPIIALSFFIQSLLLIPKGGVSIK
ncbi:accessory gene regulator B family protein [Brevibacillus laterosporus]|nr:accessory gene regulator B family protein [Brevibacillus laterosporus]MBG9775420.1 accessory gene regulator AgrB [Brevibacillus laterosporus]MBG9800165.1 accessory gene regulator AgrB [Brevibacillus laterosporus]MCR8938270.1 accessory gene regulator B family protein [Brevibacillus laterosporus]MCZ0840910.1 accessory gene regulator B family protein [Brevibacillus laterosporus]MCZ0843540.1 accessory gene regulator B family protein [Brevibacillus laterosporus]